MKSKKATQESIQEHNLGLILRYIKEDKNFSRAKLSSETGLSKSTVSSLADILITKKIITEGKKIDSKRGKKPIILKFNKNYCYIAAIILGIKFITLAIANLNGEIIYKIKRKNYPNSNKNKMLDNLFNIIETSIKTSKISLDKIYLFSIGTHGVVNPLTKILSSAPYLPKLKGINLVEIFKKRYKKEVILENSVNLGAVGEHWKSFNNINNLVYVSISYGIAAGIIINRELVTGVDGSMGEIAYLPILKEYNPKKIKENKFELGLFESQVDIIGITNTIRKELKEHNNFSGNILKKDIDKINFNDICKLYNSSNDNLVKKIIDNDIIKMLAIGISSLIAIIDTSVIILNGKVIDLGNNFISNLRKEIYDITPFNPDIVVSKLEKESPIIGAVKFGLDHMNDLLYHNFFSLLPR